MRSIKTIIRRPIVYPLNNRLHFRYSSTAQAAGLHVERISEDVLKQHAKESRYLLSRCNDINQVCDIIRDTPMADTALYNTALHECFKRLYKEFTFYDVDLLLHKMDQNKIPKDIATYHEILKIYSRSKKFNKCISYFNDMVDKDRIKPNVVTFNRLMKCCRYSNSIADANEILRLMRNDFNVLPDLYTYSELMYLYAQLQATDLFEDNLIQIEKELKSGRRTYSLKEFTEIIEAMDQNKVAMEHIEHVFDIMLNQNIIPGEELLNKMIFIVIGRKDAFRVISYFDMLVELMTNSKQISALSVAVRALELLIARQNDFASAFCFIDNCITYGIKITNPRILSMYWQCIKCCYMDLAQYMFQTPMHMDEWQQNAEYVMSLIQNAKDLPAQLEKIQMMNILNKYSITASTVIELYSDILISLLNIKVVDNEQVVIDGKDVVYEILSHWYDSYYVTRDLWNDYCLSKDGELSRIENIVSHPMHNNIVTVFNVCDWNAVELKTLFIFLILERFGDIFINEGNKILYVNWSAHNDVEIFNILKDKLIMCYGDELKIELMDLPQYNILKINLESWQTCVHPESEDEDSDDDLVDKDLYLPQ